jgi:hypothetical protein
MPFVVLLLMILVFLHKIMLRIYFKNMNFKYGVLYYIILHNRGCFLCKGFTRDSVVRVERF